MKQPKRLMAFWVLLGLVLAAAAAGMAYTRPTTLGALCPAAALSDCTRLSIEARQVTADAGASDCWTLDLDAADPTFPALLETLTAPTVYRKLSSLLGDRGQAHLLAAGDIRWTVRFFCPEDTLVLENFFGALSLDDLAANRQLRIRAAGQGDYLAAVFRDITAHPAAVHTTEP